MEDDPAGPLYTKAKPKASGKNKACGSKSPAEAPRFKRDIALLPARDAAEKRKREVNHANLMKQMHLQSFDADSGHRDFVKQEGKRLDKEKQHLRDAYERRKNMNELGEVESDIRMAMDYKAITRAEEHMFEMIDRQSAAQRQKAEMERAKLKKSGRVNFAGLADTEAPRLRLGEVLEKKPDTGFSLYKQKITEDGKPFWLSQGDDHLAHIQSIPGMQENGGTPICHPTIEPGEEESTWKPMKDQPKPKWYIHHKCSLLAAALFFCALAVYMLLPRSVIYPEDPDPTQDDTPFPSSEPTGSVSVRLRLDFDTIAAAIPVFKKEFGMELATVMSFASSDRIVFSKVFADGNSLLADHEAGEVDLLSHQQAKTLPDGSRFDPSKGTYAVFVIEGSPREGPPTNETAPAAALANLFEEFKSSQSRLYSGKYSSRLTGIELPNDQGLFGCVRGCVPPCSGHGLSLPDGSCQCHTHYNVSNKRPGHEAPNDDCSVMCSGLGDVRQEGCVCQPNVGGSDCEEVCSDHGTLSSDGSCSCRMPWTSSDCSVPCSARGNMLPDSTCSCWDKLSGTVCQVECNGHGAWRQDASIIDYQTALPVTNCSCSYPYSGLECNIPCSGHGSVVPPFPYTILGRVCCDVPCCGTEPCDKGNCASCALPTIAGLCEAMTQCSCDTGYAGWRCEMASLT